MGKEWIAMDGAGFATGFVLSFPTEKDFIEAHVQTTYMEHPVEGRKSRLKAIYKAAKLEEKKQ